MDKTQLLQDLADIVAPMPVLSTPEAMLVYECDGHTLDKAPPVAVAFPTTTAQVVALVKLANRYDLPFVARGAGTGLSGGALALDGVQGRQQVGLGNDAVLHEPTRQAG